MDWIKLIIGGIVVLLWIANAIKEQQKNANKDAPRPLPPPEPLAKAPAKKPEQLEEFLRDIRGRVDEAGGKPREEPMTAILVEEPPRSVPPPPPPPRIDRPKKIKQKRQRPGDLPPTLPPISASPPAPGPELPPMLPPPSIAEAKKRLAQDAIAATSSALTPTITQRRLASPSARQAVSLLKSPTGLATAFLLREILDEPLCKRRRHQTRR